MCIYLRRDVVLLLNTLAVLKGPVKGSRSPLGRCSAAALGPMPCPRGLRVLDESCRPVPQARRTGKPIAGVAAQEHGGRLLGRFQESPSGRFDCV